VADLLDKKGGIEIIREFLKSIGGKAMTWQKDHLRNMRETYWK
jgi:hypothetical protein